MNKAVFLSATACDMLSKESDRFFQWKHGRICYQKEGTGTPILLIHELSPTASGFEWHSLKKELIKKHTVYTVDLLGCGRSEKPGITYTVFLYVQLISDFIKTVIGSPCDVVTSGNASSLCLMSCAYRPEWFRNMIFINPEQLSGSLHMPDERSKWMKRIIEFPVYGTMVYNILHSKMLLALDLRLNKYYRSENIKEIHIQALHEACHLGSYKAKYLFGSIEGHYTNLPTIEAAGKIQNHLAILGGTGEAQIEQTIADYQKENPSIQSKLIPDSVHYPHIENPEKTAKYIETYISLL